MIDLSRSEKEALRKTEEYKRTKAICDFYFTKITKLSPKYDSVLPPEYVYAPRYQMFKKNCSDFSERWNEVKKVSKILKQLKTLEELEHALPELLAMNKMLVYLGLVESLGVTLSDMILILLMANEKEIHSRGQMTRHVAKVAELDDINSAYKLDFLKNEGFTLFKQLINTDVRNHIAHLKFSINKRGEIRKRNGSPIHIDKSISDFWHSANTLILVFEDIGFLKWFVGTK